MKKLLLHILFLMVILPGMSQGIINIGGTVTDTATSAPIANHAVTIVADSSGGWFYYHIVYTDINGSYRDTVITPVPGGSPGTLYVSTIDCQNYQHQVVLNYNPASYNFTVDFAICNFNTPCIANFTYNQFASRSFQFSDLSQTQGNPVTWDWNFGDGGTSTVQNPQHIYGAAGWHPVTLSISNNSGCSANIVKNVYAGDTTSTPVYLTISGTVTNSLTSIPMPGHAVTWGIDDTLVAPRTIYTDSNGFYTDSLLLSVGVISGNYYVWTQDCEYTEELSGSYNSFNYHLHQDFFLNCEINPPCQAKMKVSAAGILTVQFEDKSTGGVSSRVWNFGDGATSTTENPIHAYGSQGDFLVTLSTVNNITGCSNTTTKLIRLADSLLCNASFSFSNTQLPKTIQFQDLSYGSSNIRSWYFGDGDTSSLANPQHTFRKPGLYLVILSVGNFTTTCWQSYARPVLITDSLVPCQSGFTYTTSPVTGPKMVQFTDLSSGTPSQWLWEFGDGDSSALRYPIHSYAASGTYHVCLTISGNYCNSTFCQDVTIHDTVVYHQIYGQVFNGSFPATAGLAMIISSDTTGNYQPYVDVSPIDTNGVYFFTTVPGGVYYILATPSDSSGYLPTYFGNTITWEQTSPITLGTANNPYNINLAQSDQMTPGPGSASGQINMGKLKSSITDKINMVLLNAQGTPIGFTRVSTSGTFNFPSLAYGIYYMHAEMPGITSDYVKVTLSPGKPHADVVMTFSGKKILGIPEEATLLNRWLVYPNPVAALLTILLDLKHATNVNISIYNITGKMAASTQATLTRGVNRIEISTTSLPPGIYSLHINSGDGLFITTKLIKIN